MPETETPSRVADEVHTIIAQTTGLDAGAPAETPIHLTSLAATRVRFLARRSVGADIEPLAIGGCTTVGELRRLLHGSAPAAEPDAPTPVARTESAGASATADSTAVPLTELQQAYVMGRRGADPVGCHVYRELTLPGADADEVEARWTALVRRHETLRLHVADNGQASICDPDIPIEVHRHDLRSASADAVSRHRDDLRARYLTPVDHGSVHPWELTLTQLDDAVLVHLGIDATAIDGTSLRLLLAEWGAAESAADRDRPTATGLPTSLRALADLPAEQRQADAPYWAERLRGQLRPPLAVAGVSDGQPLPRRLLDGLIEPETWRGLLEVADRLEVSPTSLLLTVLWETLDREHLPGRAAVVLTTSHRELLPPGAEGLLGPFTSSLVVAMPAAPGADTAESAREVHRLLWADLGHSGIGGAAALRAAHGRRSPQLPVVFTSMVGAPNPDSGFNRHVTDLGGLTAGVALDVQVWDSEHGLHVHWDAVPQRFPAGLLELRFSDFLNALRALVDGGRDFHQLNELQQAYFVPRVAGGRTDWDGCQVHHSFFVGQVDRERLERVWLELVGEVPELRATVDRSGRWSAARRAPRRWSIPMIDAADDPDGVRLLLEREFAAAAPLLGRGPHHRITVVTTPDGDRVHLQTDLTLLDGRSIHLLVRELWARYVGIDGPLGRPIAPTAAFAEPTTASREHWSARIAALPPGPVLRVPAPATPSRRQRLSAELRFWPELRRRCAAQSVSMNALLLAALGEALTAVATPPYAITMVRWTEGTEPCRPGEHTALSWVPYDGRPGVLWRTAAAIERRLVEDATHDDAPGLAAMRRRAVHSHTDALSVVHTGILDMRAAPLAPGIGLGPWLTCTPGVALDSVTLDENDMAHACWDIDPAQLDPTRAHDMFRAYVDLLTDAADPAHDAPADAATGEAAFAAQPEPEPGPAPEFPQDCDPEATDIADLMLGEWNATDAPIASRPLYLMIDEQCDRTPDATALRWTGGEWTYRELQAQTRRAAAHLLAAGVQPGDAVAISMGRGPEMVAAALGVLRAGGHYVPVLPELPAARAKSMLDDVAARFVACLSTREGWELQDRVTRVDMDVDAVPGAADLGDLDHDDPDRLAYVVFTSGTSGRPKGVAVKHPALNNVVAWCIDRYGFGPADVGLNVTSLGFDLSVFDIFGLLSVGACMFIADEREQRDPQSLLRLLVADGITFWNSAPTTLAQLAALLPEDEVLGRDLRLVFLSGDYTPLSLPDQVRRSFPNAHIVSLGGATEATIWSNWFDVGDVDPAWRSIPYGRPIWNARYYVLDDDLRPCPALTDGDLYIGGRCLAEGYINRVELTAERFIYDPFDPCPDARLYRTGDLAHFRPDGVIVFRGRSDNQVKIRGFRVELSEIEYHLRALPEVRDAVVRVRLTEREEQKVVAYVVPAHPSAPPEPGSLRTSLAERLPHYMVPNLVCFIDILPATSNGKFDDKALPWPVTAGSVHHLLPTTPDPPEAQTGSGAGDGAASRVTALAEELLTLFRELLEDPSLDVDNDVWDHGATSFTMVQVSDAAAARYGTTIPVAVLLDEPTCRGIASALAQVEAPAAGEIGSQGEALPEDTAAAEPASTASLQPEGPEESAEPAPGAATQDSAERQVDLFDAAAVAAFKDGRAWEPDSLPPGLPLPRTDYLARSRRRAARRDFSGALTLSALAGLLSCVAAHGSSNDRRRPYPSAGDTYGVRTYVCIRPGGVDGLPDGWYYHHPERHTLHRIGSVDAFGTRAHFVYNRPMAQRAACEIYLIGRRAAVAPLYGDYADRFLTLEAGQITQLLMDTQSEHGVALCPVGSVALEPLATDLGLADDDLFLVGLLCGHAPGLADEPAEAQAGPQKAHEPEVAVAAVAARFPGCPDGDLSTWWARLADGERFLALVPGDRPEIATGELSTITGGWLPIEAGVDPLTYGIAPAEWRRLDPQTRRVLPVAADALGELPAQTRAATGVFVAAMWTDHQHVGADGVRAGGTAEISSTASDLASRVAHVFGCGGPVLAVDTSCSSSLTALHLAGQALRGGECEAALVVGVNVFSHPYHLRLLRDQGLLAAQRPAGAFDADHPGWLPGEACAAILLRRADDVPDDAAPIIEATRVQHTGGKPRRFASPDQSTVEELVRGVLASAGISSADVGYIEGAAAGAVLADAAEQAALGEVFGRDQLFGTGKPQFGHAEAAAGMAQLVRALLMMRRGEVLPTVVADTGFGGGQRLTCPSGAVTPWPGDDPRRALVLGVGATGSQAAVLLRVGSRARRPLVPAAVASAVTESASSGAVATTPAPAAAGLAVRARIRSVVAQVMEIANVDDFHPLADYGLTSRFAVAIADAVRGELPLTAADVLQAEDVAALADVAAARGVDSSPEDEAPRPADGQAPDHADVAIVGVAGRFPGARDVDALWQLLLRRGVPIGPPPAYRAHPGRDSDRMTAGYCEGVGEFDPVAFGLTPKAARRMDPQERELLKVTLRAFETAGLGEERRRGRTVGTFVGAMYNEYPFYGVESGGSETSGSGLGSLANRLAYQFDLAGPSLTVDSMCSSGLVALHLAVRSLRAGECDTAVVAGVNLHLHPTKFVALDELDMSADDDRCRSFGAGGTGFVPGEGTIALVCRPLAAAVADGDSVFGVVKGSAIGHGGRAPGFTVPQAGAQADVIRRALADAQVPPEQISYVETHGTGTALGDPIEIQGLTAALGHDRPGRFSIGSVKGNLGHLEAASGLAGLVKVLLQLRHGCLAPSLLNSDELNPEVDWSSAPCAVQLEPGVWEPQDGAPRLAGVSAFGAGGTNAHVIVAEPPVTRVEAPAPGPSAVLFSASDAEGLARQVGDVRAWLTSPADDDPLRLGDIARLTQQRTHQRERAAVVVSSVAELIDVLAEPEAMIRGTAARTLNRDVLALQPGDASSPGELREVAEAWARGAAVTWPQHDAAPVHPATAAGLPGQVFREEFLWFDPTPRREESTARLTPAVDPEPTGAPMTVAASAGEHALWERVLEPAAETSRTREGYVLLVARASDAGLVEQIRQELHQPCVVLTIPERYDGSRADALAGSATAICEALRPSGLLDLTGDRRDVADTALAIVHAALRAGTVHRVLSVGRDGPSPLTGAALAAWSAETPSLDATSLVISDPSAARIVAAWRAAPRGEVRSAPDGYRVPRWRRAAAPTTQPSVSGTWLVTGGTSGLGARVVEHLLARGADRVVVWGRSATEPDVTARLRAAASRAVDGGDDRIVLVAVDLIDPHATALAWDAVLGDASLRGIVHCAGEPMGAPDPLRDRDHLQLLDAVTPKYPVFADAIGALADREVRLIAFSSIAGAVPATAVGVGGYGIANGAVDRSAEAAEAAEGRARVISVAWPPWEAERLPAAVTRAGFRSLSVADGLRCLDEVLSTELTGRLLVAPVDWSESAPSDGGSRPAPDRSTAGASVGAAGQTDQTSTPIQVRAPGPTATTFMSVEEPPCAAETSLPQPSHADAADEARRWLCRQVADLTGLRVDDVPDDLPLTDVGLDSIVIRDLVERIEGHLSVSVDPTLVLESPTVVELARTLAPDWPAAAPVAVATAALQAIPDPVAPAPVVVPAPEPPVGSEPEEPAQPAPAGAPHRLSVLGIGCRFPGADGVGEFAEMLWSGRSAITGVPAGRWDVAGLYDPVGGPGRSVSKWGGFLDDIEGFDPEAFGLKDEEARDLDPAVRLVLEAARAAIADAGYRPEELTGQRVGVVIGARMSRYRERIALVDVARGLGGDQNYIAAQLAQQYDWRGPCLVIDSACSSALSAVAVAGAMLATGECDYALVGGVEVLLDELPYVEFTAAGALSPSGRCATFSSAADGFVPGEGVGLVLLRKAGDARRAGDRVRAYIEGWAVGNDGRTMGATTPNPQAQEDVIRRAWQAAGRSPAEMALAEAHGTATPIGDPVELRALRRVLDAASAEVGGCFVGSVKSNVGHLLSAAGAVGLIKALLAVEHGRIPPTLHVAEPNPRLGLDGSPIVVATQGREWPRTTPRCAGVSAFGLGGTNAHVVVADADDARDAARRPIPLPELHRRRLWHDPFTPTSPAEDPRDPAVEPARPGFLSLTITDLPVG